MSSNHAPYPPSWYAASATPLPPQPALEGTLEVDVAILGGGYVGLNAAIELAQAGYSVAVLEAERVGWGASGRNGGQVLPGFGCGESKLLSLVGREDARRMFAWSVEGMDLLQDRLQRFGIDCDWRPGHATVAIKPRHIPELEGWQRDLTEAFGYTVEWWDADRLRSQLDSPRYRGGMYDPRAGHLHPLKYALGLARAAQSLGVKVFEGSEVLGLTHGPNPVLRTARGEVRCKAAILAGNALVKGIAPQLDRKIMPVGTYIAATTPLGEERARALLRNDMAVADTNWALDYFRLSADHRLLFGGRASYSNFQPPNLRWVMARRMHKVFPQLRDVEFEYAWGGTIDISLNRAPHWGRIGHGNVYFAQGFSGHGVAATGLAGRVIADAVRGDQERLDVFRKIQHFDFPGGRTFRTPLLVAAMAWYKLRDAWW